MENKLKQPCINECAEITAGGNSCGRCLRTADEALKWYSQSSYKMIEVNDRVVSEKWQLVLTAYDAGKIPPANIMRKLDELLKSIDPKGVE